jgi:hypothetical protein
VTHAKTRPIICHKQWELDIKARLEKRSLHIIRLYEQLSKKKATPEEVASALGLYVKRWRRWTQAGLFAPVNDSDFEITLRNMSER